MLSELDLSFILITGIVTAGLALNRGDKDGTARSLSEPRSNLTPTEHKDSPPVPPYLSLEASRVRWGELKPGDGSSQTASTTQPRGPHLGLIPLARSASAWGSEDDDTLVSVQTAEGLMCSVNTSQGLVCTSAPMGCARNSIDNRARDWSPVAP